MAAQMNAELPLDLLGDTSPATPAMDAPLPWRVYRMDDCDWWVARTLEEAKASYQHQTGVDDECIEDARELSDAELDSLYFVDTDDRDRPVKGTRRTFRVELDQRAAWLSKPELFASTEY
jgi:hypothetical protein